MSTAKDVPPPPPRLGPLQRASPIFFQPSHERVAIAPVVAAVREWTASDDGATRAEIGCRRGVRLVQADGIRSVGRTATRVTIARDGGELAREEGGRIHRVDARTGSEHGAVEGSEATYLDDGALAWRRGCEWHVLEVGADAPAMLGRGCGRVIRSERGHARLWLSEHSTDTLDAASGPVTAIIGLAPDQVPLRIALEPPARDVAISPDASILCVSVLVASHDVLRCRLADGGEFENVADDVVGTPQFADDARRMVFTTGHEAHPPHDLHLVDFDHRIVRKLGRVAHRRLAFLPGAEHVVAFDGARGLVFELATAWITPFGEASDDWVAIGPAPEAGSFFASRRRAKCPQLVRVGLPSRDL